MVATGALRPDSTQESVIARLDQLLEDLKAYGVAVDSYRESVREYQAHRERRRAELNERGTADVEGGHGTDVSPSGATWNPEF